MSGCGSLNSAKGVFAEMSDSKNIGRYRIVLAQCTKAKRDERSIAADLYDESNYFRAQRAYARTADKWAIQSALHGLLWPHEEADPYDAAPDGIRDTDRWAASIAHDIEAAVSTEWVVEILGGAAYADPLTPELEIRGFEVHEPLRGLGIGERMARLNEMRNRTLKGFA